MSDQQLSLFDAASAPAKVAPPALDTLKALSDECQSCRRCALAESRQHVVFARGNPAAKLMLIGEGPGQHEDETGLPFVGRAGQLLDKILASVGLDREQDVYIANVVKCRPPANRVPTPEEMAGCKSWLDAQIELIHPRVILLAGGTALKGVLGVQEGITRLRGQWIERDGRWYMPVFHPSFLLRNDSREVGAPKWLTWQDMKQVKARLEGI